MEHNSQLVTLIDSINHISLNHNDLLEVALDFSDLYFSKKTYEEKKFDKFWDKPEFIEAAVIATREAVVLAMQAITLDENVPFIKLVTGCVNLESQQFYIQQISTNVVEQKVLRDFLKALRQEIFSRIYKENTEMNKITGLSEQTLKNRYDSFITQEF